MNHPNFILLYTKSPETSREYYSKILKKEAIESSPNFVMFALDSGLMLGLWASHDVQPKPIFDPNLSAQNEIAIAVDENHTVDEMFSEWENLGVSIVQKKTMMDFGYTFVATDPHGHRLRVFAPKKD